MTAVILFDFAVEFGEIALIAPKLRHSEPRQQHYQNEHKRYHQQHGERHLPRRYEHSDKHRYEHTRRRKQHRYRLIDVLSQSIHVVGDYGQRVAVNASVVIVERHFIYLLGNSRAQALRKTLCDSRHYEVGDIVAQRVRAVKYDEYDRYLRYGVHIDCACSGVIRYLVGKFGQPLRRIHGQHCGNQYAHERNAYFPLIRFKRGEHLFYVALFALFAVPYIFHMRIAHSATSFKPSSDADNCDKAISRYTEQLLRSSL